MQTMRIGMRVDQASTQSVAPDKIEEYAGKAQRRAVNEGSHLDVRSDCEAILREDRGGEWQQRSKKQQKQIVDQQDVVAPLDVVEHRVMIGPDHANLQEAEHVRQVQRPLLQQCLRERLPIQRLSLWHMQVKHEQCDDDGKHAVTECLDSRG